MKLFIGQHELLVVEWIVSFLLQGIEYVLESKLDIPLVHMFEVCPAEAEAADLHDRHYQGSNAYTCHQTHVKGAGARDQQITGRASLAQLDVIPTDDTGGAQGASSTLACSIGYR